MTSHAQAHAGHAVHRNYVKIWGILVLLLIVSVFGPMIGIRWITLIAAFGVALVKAYMVAKNFMHLDVEKPIVHWMLFVVLGLMVLLYGALAPDIEREHGAGWKKDAGFHHSFTTSEGKHHQSGHGADDKGSTEHGKP